MIRKTFLPLLVIGGLAFGRRPDTAKAETSVAGDNRTQAVVAATTAFLNSLSAVQRQQVQFAFEPQKTATAAKFPGQVIQAGRVVRAALPAILAECLDNHLLIVLQATPLPAERREWARGDGFIGEQYGQAVWSNYPVSDVPRPGLRLGSLSSPQHEAAMRLLKVALSAKGYQKVVEIMGSDQALSDTGTPYCSGTACYTIGIFGEPSSTRAWMLEFGGHHLALNLTIAGAHGVITPTLTGAQPAVYTSNGRTVRVLAQENDKAFALLNALDDAQRKQATLNYEVHDLVLGPGHAGEAIQPEGLQASAMNEKQKAILLDVISEWADIINEAYAESRMAEIKTGLDNTYFAWSGPTTHDPGKNGSAYYRIQGPKVIIEFSPQGVGGDPTMHVHTIYRDPTNDYGRSLALPTNPG